MKRIFSNCRGSLGSLLKINYAASALKSRFRRSDMVPFSSRTSFGTNVVQIVRSVCRVAECSAPFSYSRYEMDLNLVVTA